MNRVTPDQLFQCRGFNCAKAVYGEETVDGLCGDCYVQVRGAPALLEQLLVNEGLYERPGKPKAQRGPKKIPRRGPTPLF